MTPIIRGVNAHDPALERAIPIFLRKHRRTRFMVECAIGIWKEQFPCLNQLRIRSPTRISILIYACAVLHNMQNNHRHGSYAYDMTLNRIANEEPVLINPEEDHNQENANNDIALDGIQRQRELMQYFIR